MRTLVLTLLFSLLLPFSVAQAQESNAGIVQGLWYGDGKVFADTTVRIYVAIRNNTGSDLTGTVEFLDNAERIDRKTVQALDGRIIESWADWKPTYGTHTVRASLSRIELHTVGSSTQAVTVVSSLAEDDIFVDYDTDGDDIGNKDDTDDDGDGISDADEKQNGTNPLIKNAAVVETSKNEEVESEDTRSNTDNSRDDTEDTDLSSSQRQQGLEQYLAPSPAETALGGATVFINTTKAKLDSYREVRSEKKEANASSSKTKVNEDGFGEITRSSSTNQKILGEGFFDKALGLIGFVIDALYTFILYALSLILGHPILVQVGLLILILFALWKFASSFGKRPKGYGK